MKRFTVLVWRQFNYPVPVLDKSWFKMLVSGKSVDGSPCLALLCVCANCRWILLVHSSRTFLIVISLEGLINFIHYIVLRKYCFLFPGKRNLESTAWGCWFLCDFAPVNFPWSHLSSAAFPCCCFRSFLAQSGGLNSVLGRSRTRMVVCRGMGRLTAFLSSISWMTVWTTVVWLQSFHSTRSCVRPLLRHRII